MKYFIFLFLLVFLLGCAPQQVEQVKIAQDSQPLPRNTEVYEPKKIVEGGEEDIDPVVESEEDQKIDQTPQELPKPEKVSSFTPTGDVLAGSTSPYIAFNQQDYDQALEEGRTVFLYFYANWCPICKAEQKHTIAAFAELNNPNLIGFRVNYKDSETDKGEEALAKEFGITYQHTKIVIRNGQESLKDLQSWNKEQYLEQLA